MAANESYLTTARRLFELARTKPDRTERDELLDMSYAHLVAGETGAALARAAMNVRDEKYFRETERRFRVAVSQLPAHEDIPAA